MWTGKQGTRKQGGWGNGKNVDEKEEHRWRRGRADLEGPGGQAMIAYGAIFAARSATWLHLEPTEHLAPAKRRSLMQREVRLHSR